MSSVDHNSPSFRRLTVWAHSECRSNAALFAAVKRLAEARGLTVKFCLWDVMPLPEDRKIHSFEAIRVGDDLERGREVLRTTGGTESVHVFCVYQNSSVWRRLIAEAKATGARVVVNAEAPCEMCLGVGAWLKRIYYRWVLPLKVRGVVKAADLFLSASGVYGKDRLLRLGWTAEKIVPFGYASPRLSDGEVAPPSDDRRPASPVNRLKVLFLGSEAPYRGVSVAIVAAKMAGVELVRTGGKLSVQELVRAIRGADIVVGCGFCEPWGMRISDALLEGVPVVVSDGMGVSWAVEKYGCGCVVPRGEARALAAVLDRCNRDRDFLARLKSGAQVAAKELMPERKAREWLERVIGG